jgi:hypothetical protein
MSGKKLVRPKVERSRKEPRRVVANRKGAGGNQGAELARVRVRALAILPLIMGVGWKITTMERGVESGIYDRGQGPGGTVSGERAFHGAPIAKEEHIGGVK